MFLKGNIRERKHFMSQWETDKDKTRVYEFLISLSGLWRVFQTEYLGKYLASVVENIGMFGKYKIKGNGKGVKN